MFFAFMPPILCCHMNRARPSAWHMGALCTHTHNSSRMLKHLCTFHRLIRTPFFDSVTSSLRKHNIIMVFRFIRRRFFSNKKWVLLLVVYLVGIYYLANMLTRVVDKYDTIKQGGEKGEVAYGVCRLVWKW